MLILIFKLIIEWLPLNRRVVQKWGISFLTFVCVYPMQIFTLLDLINGIGIGIDGILDRGSFIFRLDI